MEHPPLSGKRMDSALDLDPGTVHRRKGASTLGCKCFVITAAVFAGLLVALAIGKVLSGLAYDLKAPLARLYENKTWEEVDVKDWSKVVRPLVDEEQRFDIVATVWVVNSRRLQVEDESETEEGYGAMAYHHDLPGANPSEDVVFSNVVFRGVTLKDKHVHSEVNLSIPLDYFTEDPTRRFSNYDLRASFTLHPQAPSLLDHMTNFSSWKPSQLVVQNVSPPPSPASQKTIQQQAIDSFGFTIPMIDFRPIKSRCPEAHEEARDEESSEDDEAAKQGFANVLVTGPKKSSPTESHPYIITRTDLRVARMTELYNLKAYNAHRNELKGDLFKAGCWPFGLLNPSEENAGVIKDERSCHRQFGVRGNAETRIDLSVPAQEGKESAQTIVQYAYAPYFDATPRSWGPMDLSPMPLKREECSMEQAVSSVGSEGVDKSLNVVWKLAFSGSSPFRLFVAGIVGHAGNYNMSDTAHGIAKAQQEKEAYQRLHGHKFSQNGRVGRKRAVGFIQEILMFLIVNLHILYWYTRRTTAGLSTLSSLSVAAERLINLIETVRTKKAFSQETSVFTMLYILVLTTWTHISLVFLVLRVILRLEVVESAPFVKIMPASHLERASSRLEFRGRSRVLLGMAAFALVYAIASPFRQFALIPRIGPSPPLSPSTDYWHKIISTYILLPLSVTATIYQLTHNHRSKTFAGQYKLTAILILLHLFLRALVLYLPWFAGDTLLIRDAFTLGSVVQLLTAAAWVIQAMRLPKVSQDIDDKDDK